MSYLFPVSLNDFVVVVGDGIVSMSAMTSLVHRHEGRGLGPHKTRAYFPTSTHIIIMPHYEFDVPQGFR
jgi:hypothetical protein